MAAETDRHLLFGLLALQTGLIDQGQLVAAFHAWTQDKARPLGDHLVARGDLDAAQRSVIEALAALHTEKHEGDARKSLAAISAEPSTRESLAELGDSDLGGTLIHVGSDSPSRSTEDDRTKTYSVGTSSSNGQRFRVLRPHARGGLGAVFVAIDGELHREVALKQILDGHADDPHSRQRFLMEAEITGGLEHPGIVPVYGLGTYGDGRPYYAMRFIRGDSLREAIDRFRKDESLKADSGRRSLALRKLLRRFTDVCNAIEYAHSRGVLHRDIKPGNVIVGKHGETLVVDWGLAKATGRSEPLAGEGERTLMPASASGSAETLPGQALGTPGYMSPEQARGDLATLGPRSDVYSLGATLYCLLTGKPPFEGDVADVLRAVEHGEFRPPRSHDPSIDPALEAVCMKAMAMKPDDRYASCRALADDVERWAADEPVSAYAEPLSRRARRWANRNRTLVTAAAVALVAGLAGLGAIATVQSRANGKLETKNRELSSANEQVTKTNAALKTANDALVVANEKKEARYRLAVEAIKTFHTGVSEDFLLKENQFKALRDQLLKSASDFYEKLGAMLKDASDLPSRRSLLQANYEVAELAFRVGRKQDALAMHRRVLADREKLAAELGADPAMSADVARSLLAVGVVLQDTSRTDEALAAYARARKAVAAADGGPPDDPAARQVFADAELEAGWLLNMISRTAEALPSLKRARDLQATLVAANPEDVARHHALSRCQIGIGLVLSTTGELTQALASFKEARAASQAMAQARPNVIRFQIDLATGRYHVGNGYRKLQKPVEALAELKASLEIMQKVADANPAVLRLQTSVAKTHQIIGNLHSEAMRLEESRVSYEAARDIYRRVVEADPANAEARGDLATLNVNMGHLLEHLGQLPESMLAYEEARTALIQLCDADPADTELQSVLAETHMNIGATLSSQAKPAEALESLEVARGMMLKLAKAYPALTRPRQGLAKVDRNVAQILADMDSPDESAPSLLAAQAILKKMADTHPEVAAYRQKLLTTLSRLAERHRADRQFAAASDDYDRAIAIADKLVRENPTNRTHQVSLATGFTGRATARLGLGEFARAAGDIRRAQSLWNALPSRSGEGLFQRACCHADLSALAGRAGSGVSAGRASGEADRAMALLKQAVGMGYHDPEVYRKEPALDPLRERADFRTMMMDLAMPADVFVHSR